MNTIDQNTINAVKAQVAAGKKSLKAIAKECGFYERQADNDAAQAIYARLADCKTRAQFNAVFASI